MRSVSPLVLVDNCRVGVVAKWRIHNLQLDFVNGTKRFSNSRMRIVPTSPLTVLAEFFDADVETNVHLLPVFYFLFPIEVSLLLYVYDIYISCSAEDTVSSCNWFTVSKVLTFNIAILIKFFSSKSFWFGFELCSRYLKHWDQISHFRKTCPLLTRAKGGVVLTYGLN